MGTVREGQNIPGSPIFYRLVPYQYSKLRDHFYDCHSFYIFSFSMYRAEAQVYVQALSYKTSSLWCTPQLRDSTRTLKH